MFAGNIGGAAMSDTVIVSLISFAGTCIGAVGGIIASIKMTTYRISQLEEKVNKHNKLIERTYKLEGRMTEAEHDIRDIKTKI